MPEYREDRLDILDEPIAIVGANCQFPGMNQDIEELNAFHEMLLKKQTPIKEVPENRWDVDAYYDPDRQKEDKVVSRKGGFLENPRLFDAAFFKIPPVEAKQIDPQHRLFLEVAVRALNDANITLDSLKNSNAGVYCGLSTNDYSQLNYKDQIHFNAYTYIGSADSAAAGRLSYFLNLKGPCVTVDTACSSSLSALHLAVMALRTRQCDMAIVGGVHLSLSPEVWIGLSKANMLSAVGESRSFDAQADGYVRSEGCAVVVLKRLDDAINDDNKIHAVIKSVIMNQDGGGMGMAAPNLEAQIAMHHSALDSAHLAASDIDYIETHGTGTVLGDAIELQAIQSIHQDKHAKDNPLVIGALKSNLGHTISTSGIAALIKVIGTFKNEMIPANLHYSTPNQTVNPESIPALIPIESIPFSRQSDKKRYVQISNFGFTGTNVSAIIEEPPQLLSTQLQRAKDEAVCFVLSAKSEFSLREMLKNYVSYLQASEASLSDICYTLINCRDHFKFRCAIVAEDKESLIKKIESGDYTIQKVAVKKEITVTEHNAEHNYTTFLSGANIRSDKSTIQFHPVDLPLYVFDRKTYWHDVRTEKEVNAAEDWCYELQWQSQAIDKHNYYEAGRRWLLIGESQDNFGLQDKGITLVRETDNYSFEALDGIIVAENFNSSPAADIDTRIERQKKTLKKILALLQSLDERAIQLRLIVLTANATTAHGKDAIHIDSSPLEGFCKTLCLELPQYQPILIELDTQNKDQIAAQVLDEMNCNHGQNYEHVVSYREGKRLALRLNKAPLPKKKDLVHPEGRYLITGGCGGLGLVTARALLAVGARELILVSRTVDTPAIRANIKALHADFPDPIIRTVSLDVSDKAALQELLAELNEDGLLKGIIHAAGAPMNKPLLEHQEHDIDHLFSAKVKGGWYLHELTQKFDLDFFVVYSSISSVFGSNKEAFYSATNSFLDALIAERQRLGLVGAAVQWGPWAEVGMAKKRSRDQGLKEALIHNEQGEAFIQRLINSHLSHVTIISPAYLQFMLDFVPEPRPAFYKSLAATLNKATPTLDAELSPWLSDYSSLVETQQTAACKRLLLALCKELLGVADVDDLDEDAGFFELGFDSLMMAELASLLKDNLKPLVQVVATIAFDYPSINKLANHLQGELGKHFIHRERSNATAELDNDSIAIIGMSCSLPNAPDIDGFQHLLENGLSGIKAIPIERWDNQLYYDANPDAPGKTYVSKLGLIDNIKLFDPEFFGISPREAPFLDPQQRLFLEHSYHALEHANYPVHSLRGSATGVFAGVGSSHEYYTLLEKRGFSPEEQGMLSVTGKALNIVSGRVAYAFDFKGPALSIDTACSSSLVAIHYACNSLKNGEIDFALAGGVNILLRPDGIINLSKAKALSPTNQCKTFDEDADGYVRSEGCGVLFLKRMGDALRDKDRILAVIKGTAINNDGKSAGLTVPNGKSQEEVMRKALSQSQLAHTDINYIEAHGTGTSLGDPIEVHAINAVYGASRDKDHPLYIGAVKTNIGHLESAAGVAGLIKVIIGLQNKKLYKNLNFNRLNPNIKLEGSQIAVQNRDWQSNTTLRSAGVSAFGFSGTNAHIIVREFPQHTVQKPSVTFKTNALVLSAKSQIAMDHLVQSWHEFLATTKDDFTDVCFTAAVGREHYPYRLVLIANDAATASELLKNREFVTSSQTKHDLNLPHDRTLNSLVGEYLQGKNVDWVRYYSTHHQTLRKVTLPNYPFARNEFWLDLKVDNNVQRDRISQNTAVRENEEQPQLKQGDFVSQETAAEHLYEVEWTELNPVSLNAAKVPDFWVISTNEMRAQKILGSLRYQLIDHFDKLEHVEDKNIIFLYEEDQFYALYHCCQKMFQSTPKKFILVTENAYAINNVSGKVKPNQTMASAFWKSFRNELELAENYAIDLDAESTLNACLEYMSGGVSEETQFAVRNATLYVPRLRRKKMSVNTKQLFDREASYLITGGTGGLAKPLIEYLIRRGVQHIVIISRSDCSLETKKLIERAREKGVSITHYSVDASDLAQMEIIVATLQQSAQQLKGVFHLAGVIQNDLIVNLSTEALQQVLRAKMESALILHQLTKEINLDMFVLFSSASSILGSRRQANYAAANGFLDGLAHLRRQHNLPALSINWGVFRTGMAAGKIDSLKKRGFIPLDPQSINILDLFLQSDLAQIVLCPIQWDLYFKNTLKTAEFSDLDEPMASLAGQPFLNFLRQHSQREQNQILSEVVSAIAADVLGLEGTEKLRKKNDLFAMGMDSLMSLELRSRIHDKLKYPNLNLPIEYFINDARIDKITANISKELNKIFAQDDAYKPAEEVRGGAVTLSDTQYGFWLINRGGYSVNCPRQIQLHGALDVELLYKAFAFTINQNGAFWLNFNKDIPIQMLKRQGEFTLHYDDISSYYDQNKLNELFYYNTDEDISLTDQPLIRVHLYKLKEDLHELHIIIPHIILDDYAYRLLLKQFEDNYQTLLQGKSLIPVQEQHTYLNYVKQNNRDYEKDLDDKIAFWQAYNSGFQKLNLGSDHHLPDAARQAQNLFHYPMDEHFVERFKDWHKENNLNVSTGLIAAFQIVFYKLSAQKKIPIMVLHNGREDSRYNATVGLCIEYKRINITLDERYTYKELFKSIENEFIKATPFQKCSQYIKSIGFKESPFSITHQAITLYDKLFAAKKLKISHPNATTRPYYLKNLSKSKWITTAFVVKDWLNQKLHTKLRLLKPNRMSVVFNINASFFLKRPVDDKFADLDMTIPNHYGSVDRAIGNRTLWIFFTKDQNNQYRLSLNGPLTTESKDLIAQELNRVMTEIMENDKYRITD